MLIIATVIMIMTTTVMALTPIPALRRMMSRPRVAVTGRVVGGQPAWLSPPSARAGLRGMILLLTPLIPGAGSGSEGSRPSFG